MTHEEPPFIFHTWRGSLPFTCGFTTWHSLRHSHTIHYYTDIGIEQKRLATVEYIQSISNCQMSDDQQATTKTDSTMTATITDDKQQELEERGTSSQSRRTKMDQTYDGWSMLPSLFDIWDLDGDGSLSVEEVNIAVANYCELRISSFQVTQKDIGLIFQEVDLNDDGHLDRREFSLFFSRFADSIDACIFDLAYFMIEQLADRVDNLVFEAPHERKRRLSLLNFLKGNEPLDDSTTTNISATELVVSRLEQERDEQAKHIRELEFKLRQREEAIGHLEQALTVHDELIATMRQQLEEKDSEVAGDAAVVEKEAVGVAFKHNPNYDEMSKTSRRGRQEKDSEVANASSRSSTDHASETAVVEKKAAGVEGKPRRPYTVTRCFSEAAGKQVERRRSLGFPKINHSPLLMLEKESDENSEWTVGTTNETSSVQKPSNDSSHLRGEPRQHPKQVRLKKGVRSSKEESKNSKERPCTRDKCNSRGTSWHAGTCT